MDVEVIRPGVDVLAVGRAHFAAEEFEGLRTLPANESFVPD